MWEMMRIQILISARVEFLLDSREEANPSFSHFPGGGWVTPGNSEIPPGSLLFQRHGMGWKEHPAHPIFLALSHIPTLLYPIPSSLPHPG